MNFDAELIARMEANIDKNGANGCWLSLYKPNRDGYGRIGIGEKMYLFSRVMLFYSDQSKKFEFQNGKIWLACHNCPIKNCVNPEHLDWGTSKKNNLEDRVRDGTITNGEKHWKAKLTEAQVLEIRREKAQNSNISQMNLAVKYGVAQTVISSIIRRKLWTHI